MPQRRFFRARALFVSLALAGALAAPAATGAVAAHAASRKAPVAEVVYFDSGSSYLAFLYTNGDSGSGYVAPTARIKVQGQKTLGSTADLQSGTKIVRMRLRGDSIRALVVKPAGS